MTPPAQAGHTPPLGFKVLTPFYDAAITLLTRERRWRTELVKAINPKISDVIVDVGSGTGSLAKAVLRRMPGCTYYGVDPDREAVNRAQRKLARAGFKPEFIEGYLEPKLFKTRAEPTKVVSSLVLHQVPKVEKSRILSIMNDLLPPGGECHIADYGHQKSKISRFLFRVTVQVIDGKLDTQPNADGILPDLMREAGFSNVIETSRIPTVTGVISLYQGRKLSNTEGRLDDT